MGGATTITGSGQSKFDLTSKALFTHADSELHCPDRELIHPCTTELRGYLKGVNERDSSFRSQAYECAQTVLQQPELDYWVAKNMTHLLLDLDTSKHFFDKDLENDNDFFQLGLKFGRRLLYHPECLKEFDEKDELECRCPVLYGKILILKLKNLEMPQYNKEAEVLFNELKSYEWKGKLRQYAPGKAFKWDRIDQIPQIMMDNLRGIQVWPESRKKDLPIWGAMEANYKDIHDEAVAAYAKSDKFRAHKEQKEGGVKSKGAPQNISAEEEAEIEAASGLVSGAYRFLFKGGNWDQILLYHGREYTEACEKAFPKTCAMLKATLPNRPQHGYPWTSNQNEQALFLRLKAGTDTETHSGPANNILNVHLGVSGVEGAKLIVGGEKKVYGWELGKVIAWDGSFDHRVHCLDCKQDRIIMMVRYMHPDITPDHYKGNKRTHFEDIPEEWQNKWAAEEGMADL